MKLRHRVTTDGVATDGAATDGAATATQDPLLELDAEDLSRLSATFSPPQWLRNLGRTSWLLAGVLLVLGGLIWILGETEQIVTPVTAALIVAVVVTPLVNALEPRVHRTGAAAIVLLSAVAIAVAIALLVVAGISSQSGAISDAATAASEKVADWLTSLGMDESGAANVKETLQSSVPNLVSTLTHGVLHTIAGIASLAFGLSLAALSLFFLLRDGPMMRGWVDRHLGVPPAVGRTITGGLITALRNYFRGVTIVGLFNGVVVLIGALILGVPLAGTIALVTFVTAYIPYIGAFVAGAFAVIIALGAKGTTTAIIMLVIVLLANGLLQNLIQPFVMGAALSLNPLVVLVLTISAGCLFGTIGLVLAAPIASAAVHITRDLSRARAAASLAPP
jgi:predicted PurR-regulated permease PerM